MKDSPVKDKVATMLIFVILEHSRSALAQSKLVMVEAICRHFHDKAEKIAVK